MYKVTRYGLCILLMINYCCAHANIAITKVLHHKKELGDKIVIMATEQPICNTIKTINDSESQCTKKFFIPHASFANDDVKAMVKKINDHVRSDYTIALEQISRPIKGISITVAYNPQKILYTQENFDAISAQKGIVFSFHNKTVLEELNKRTQGLMRYAANGTSNVPSKISVVIDCGHGGSDEGKVGWFTIKEKDLTLALGKQVASLLKKKGFNVLLSRDIDTFVGLDERTSFANAHHVDAFISIHANSCSNANTKGIETYWTCNNKVKSVEVIDNYTNVYQQLDQLHEKLAQSIHQHVLEKVGEKFSVADRKVKQSVAQVLLGSDNPAALIEIGFLSNKQETEYLLKPDYQFFLAQGISNGIISFFKDYLNN